MEKTVKNFEDYIINDSGDNDKSVWSKKTSKWIKSCKAGKGYRRICFTVDGIHYYQYLHILLAETFIPNPEGKPTVNHINHNRSDNRLENLEWATYPEQMDEITKKNISESRKGKHYQKLSESLKGKPSWNKGIPCYEHIKKAISKANSIPVIQLTKDDKFIKQWDNMKIAAENTGASSDCICRCCKGKQETSGNYKWKYANIIKTNEVLVN